jgi:hypothetical protein
MTSAYTLRCTCGKKEKENAAAETMHLKRYEELINVVTGYIEALGRSWPGRGYVARESGLPYVCCGLGLS